MSKQKIGFIGVGLMGHGMAKNIVEKGYPLMIMGHKNRKPVNDLIKRGAKEAKSPKELAQKCDVIFLCVTGTPQVEDLIRRADGIKAGARKGLILIDTSTAMPTSTLELAAELKPLGIRYVDAPLGRTPAEAQEGRLNTFVGADRKTLKEIRPILETWAENVIHVGKLGDGHKIKLINNFVVMGTVSLYAEALTTAAKSGLKLDKVADVISSGPLYCGLMENIVKKAIVGGDRDVHKFTLSNCLKDISYYHQLTTDVRSQAVVGSAVQQLYLNANNQGLSGRNIASLCDATANAAAIKLQD